jgi:hypothetical protein
MLGDGNWNLGIYHFFLVYSAMAIQKCGICYVFGYVVRGAADFMIRVIFLPLRSFFLTLFSVSMDLDIYIRSDDSFLLYEVDLMRL